MFLVSGSADVIKARDVSNLVASIMPTGILIVNLSEEIRSENTLLKSVKAIKKSNEGYRSRR